MKIAFTVFLVANFLVEALAAASLIGGPEGIANAAQMNGGMWSMHYGFAALAIASASLWCWPYRSNAMVVTAVLGILMIFHIGLFISLSAAGDQQAGMIIHAVLAVLSIGLFALRAKWCEYS